MNDRATILNLIKGAVHEVDAMADVILFGSQARGNVHEESDWDVLVVTDEEVKKEYKGPVRQRLYVLQMELGISIGSLFVNRQTWRRPTAMPVYLEIRKDGILL